MQQGLWRLSRPPCAREHACGGAGAAGARLACGSHGRGRRQGAWEPGARVASLRLEGDAEGGGPVSSLLWGPRGCAGRTPGSASGETGGVLALVAGDSCGLERGFPAVCL